MSQRFLRAVVLLLVVIALRAEGEQGPDIRALLSNTRQRVFTARIVGVTAPPERTAPWTRKSDAKLREATFYWLRVGAEYERVWYTAIADKHGEVRFRAASLADVLELRFRDRRDFNEGDLHVWTNIAFATAVNGDAKGGAEILDLVADILTDGRALVTDDLAADRVRSDANALWTQHAEVQDDIQTLLDTLGRTALPLLPINDVTVGFDRRPLRLDIYAEDQFNHSLLLEKLGLHGPAIESYRRSIEQTNNALWDEEAAQRISRISQPSRPQRWLGALSRLKAASQTGNARAVRDIVRILPDQARKAAEQELLSAWARGALVGSLHESADLEAVRSIGTARRELFGDSLVADTVRIIDSSIREKDIARLERVARAVLLYQPQGSTSNPEEAVEAFDSAGSPMANVARYHAIVNRFGAIPIDQSLEQLQELGRGIPAGHRVLQAMVEGAIGDCLAERGEFGAALENYVRAQRVFETLGEPDSVAAMQASAAHMLTYLGHPEEAWRVRRPALRTADASGDPVLTELVLRLTASDLLFDRKKWQAITLYGSVLPVPPLYASPGEENGQSLWRNPVPLYSKPVMLDALSDRPLRPDVQNGLRVAQAFSLYQRTPAKAEAMLSESITFAETTGRVATLPYTYFYRAIARCETQRGAGIIRNMDAYYGRIVSCDPNREDDAIHDLTHALSLLEARRRDTTRGDLRDLWYRVADDIFPYLMDLYWNRGDDRAVVALGERRRGLALRNDVTESTGAVEPLSLDEIAKRLEPDVALIVFTASLKYQLSTIIEKDRVQMHRVQLMTGHLYFRAKALSIDIEEDRPAEVRQLSEKLYELLIQPLKISSSTKRLVIIADDPLQDLPFAILQNPASGQYLVQQFEILRAESASAFAQTKHAGLPPLRTAVALGDPAFDRNAYPLLPALPAARAEAIAIGRQYPHAHTLIGRDATLQKLAANTADADVLHIAAHTVPGTEEDEDRKLLLAPSRQHPGAWGLGEVAELPLKKGSIVVLPGCQTATSREPNLLRNFARSFLAAGARNVVATLWEIEDDPSRTFAMFFHRSLRRCGSAITATREAQLAMLQSSNAHVHRPRAWSGFQVYGGGL